MNFTWGFFKVAFKNKYAKKNECDFKQHLFEVE